MWIIAIILHGEIYMPKTILCMECKNKDKTIKNFCSIECKHSYWSKVSKKQYENNKIKFRIRKLYLIKLKGGSCKLCGYCNNISCLIFHHKFDKSFSLDSSKLIIKNWNDILNEVKKCDLLCHNCHNELHNPNREIKC